MAYEKRMRGKNMNTAKKQHRILGAYLGLAALAGIASCDKPYEKLDRFVEGKVIEENVYEFPVDPTKIITKTGEKPERTVEYSRADSEQFYVIKIEAQEMVWDESAKTQQRVPKTYTLTVRDSAALPLRLLAQQIYVGSEVVFRTRDDAGEHMYPVNRAGSIDAQQLRVIRPYEDPNAVKQGLEGVVELNVEQQENLQQQQRYTEAQKFYNERKKMKE